MKKRNFRYTGRRTNEISFPLGGIGTGSIGFAGNGRLVDWEIMNRPNKGSANGFSHFAIKAQDGLHVVDARILNGDLNPPYTGSFAESVLNGFGFGPPRDYLSGMPHFRKSEFIGKYPVAVLKLNDENFPGKVEISAFNPLIPLNAEDSSIPAGFFSIAVKNTGLKELNYTFAFCVKNPSPAGTGINTFLKRGPVSMVKLESNQWKNDEVSYGDLCIATDAQKYSYQEYLYRGSWFDNLTRYWQEFTSAEPFRNRTYEEPNTVQSSGLGKEDYGVLAAEVSVKPGQTGRASFVITWNYPNRENYWDPACNCKSGECKPATWRNYYATVFKDSTASAVYCLQNWERLWTLTNRYKEALFSSTLPEQVLDAVSANISILKSPTVLRLEDGTLYGFEGCHCDSGCCDGSCSHVWNYEYVLPFLFPDLRRGFRDIDFRNNMGKDGGVTFRLQIPLGRPRIQFRPCVDGQFGGIVQAYREWKLSGNDGWLSGHWPDIKKMISYAWSTDNPDRWDADKDGVLEGCQHHTLDMELFGPNSWLTGMYLLALKAGAEMAEYFGETETAREYLGLFEKGKGWVDANLFNGEYYYQNVELGDKSLLEKFSEGEGWETYRGGRSNKQNYWDTESKSIKYQIGEGCVTDQVIAQWHANLCGLGEIFDKGKRVQALKAIYRHNFIKNMRAWVNPCRIYALNDEAGIIICSFPKEKPPVPIPYSEESMNGFEYQVACHMMQEGMVKEGLEIVAAVRERYDGEKRNPWNEFECGSNYARSMASYALLPTMSGFKYDARFGSMGFDPIAPAEDFSSFWCANNAWGKFMQTKSYMELKVLYGKLSLNNFSCNSRVAAKVSRVMKGRVSMAFLLEGCIIRFPEILVLSEGEGLRFYY